MANLFGFKRNGVTYEIPLANASSKGLMSADDFSKLGGIAAGAQVNVLEGVKVNGTALAIADKLVDILIATGSTNGTIAVNGVDVAVKGLGALAFLAEVSEEQLASALATKLNGKLDANNAEYTTALSNLATLIGSDSTKSVRTIAGEEILKQLIPENAKETMDTIEELVTFLQNHPDDAQNMSNAITALEAILAGFGTGEGEIATVKGYVEQAITNLNMSNYYTKSEVDTELGKKVDKADGFSLMSDVWKSGVDTKLNGIDEGANKTTWSYDESTGIITIGGVADAE